MSAPKQYPTSEYLHSIFKDVGDTVEWKVSTNNRTKVGHQVRTKCQGYYVVSFKGQRYYVHLILWIMRHGEVPPGKEVDHRDTVKTNNADSNHRLSDRSSNACNANYPPGISGVKGVTWNSDRQQWVAIIRKQGVKYFLGYFDDIASAADKVRDYREKLHGEFCRH